MVAGLDRLPDQLTVTNRPARARPGATRTTRTGCRLLSVLAASVAFAACPAGQEGTAPRHADVVDSVVPRAVALARFRSGLDPVADLSGGAASREALVATFVRALETADTTTLGTLVVTRQEFAWIYFPTAPQGLAPYDLAPELFWFMLESRGRRGLIRLLEDRAGTPMGYLRTDCPPAPSIEGENRVWGPCLVIREKPQGDSIAERLFGPIIERRGRFKFVSYGNRLD